MFDVKSIPYRIPSAKISYNIGEKQDVYMNPLPILPYNFLRWKSDTEG